MTGIAREFAGATRQFRLRLGELMDLEEACGKVGVGAIYLRLCSHQYFAGDIVAVLRLGLIGGGLDPQEAARLVKERQDVVPIIELHELAVDVIVACMSGIAPDELASGEDSGAPMDMGAVLHGFLQAGLSPDQVRAMRYDDFVAIARAAGGKSVQPPTEAEFLDMMKTFEPVTHNHGP